MQNAGGEGGGGWMGVKCVLWVMCVVNEARCFEQQYQGMKGNNRSRGRTKRNLKLKQRRTSILSEAFALFCSNIGAKQLSKRPLPVDAPRSKRLVYPVHN